MITSINRRRNQEGFTLIELLVVIIILGVLSSVVVFAVRGVGDKGQASAVAIDARTIKTAEEAHCAQFGRYASADELFAAKFLSDKPTYNLVNVTPTGPCNGTGYVINRASTLGTTGKWATLAAPPALVGDLMRLPDGKVLALTLDLTSHRDRDVETRALFSQIWDPATGAWTQTDTFYGPSTLRSAGAVAPVADEPGLLDANLFNDTQLLTGNCGVNCGKVLVRISCQCPTTFLLYDPAAPAGQTPKQQWKRLDYLQVPNGTVGAPMALRTTFTPPVTQINGPNCGNICGRVLFRGGQLNTATEVNNTWDLWNPLDGTFTTYAYEGIDADNFSSATENQVTAVLPDGKLLLVSEAGPGQAHIFDPMKVPATSPTCKAYVAGGSNTPCQAPGAFTAAPGPANYHGSSGTPQPAPVLPNGDILFLNDVFGEQKGELYTPSTNTWTTDVPDCGDSDTQYFCHVLAQLGDGRVLAFKSGSELTDARNVGSGPFGPSRQTFLYTPAATAGMQGSWAPTGIFNVEGCNIYFCQRKWADSGADALFLDPAAGPCGIYCNRVLSAGYSAEFYTP